MNAPETTLVLKNDFVVALSLLQLTWRLEAKGVGLVRDGERGVLPVRLRPSSVLSVNDRLEVAMRRAELRQLLDYIETHDAPPPCVVLLGIEPDVEVSA